MTNNTIALSEDEFDHRYPLLKNHLNPHASWVTGDGPGCLFETYGQELEFVRQQDPQTVWTFVDGDDGDQYVLSGYHTINRIGYLISTVPVPDGTVIEVHIPMSPAPDESEEPQANPTDTLLSHIASQHLGIATLTTQSRDSLDFHDVAVWNVHAALKAAFEAGRNASTLPTETPEGSPRFDDYEIHPCRRHIDADEPALSFVEPCEPFEADFWTLYGHVTGEGVQAIGDFHTREHAEEVFARITGRTYTTISRRPA